jgi:hypothetical protein
MDQTTAAVRKPAESAVWPVSSPNNFWADIRRRITTAITTTAPATTTIPATTTTTPTTVTAAAAVAAAEDLAASATWLVAS